MPAKTTYERYHEDPLKYVQILFSQSNDSFNSIAGDNQRNLDHYMLKSKLTDMRGAKKMHRNDFYFPAMAPAIQNVVDLFMEIYRSGDPTIVGKASYPNNIDPEMARAYDASANRWEDVMNAAIRPEMSNHYRDLEQWFIGLCLFQYSLMKTEMDYRRVNVPVWKMMEEGVDGIGRVKKVPEFAYEAELAMPVPRFKFKRNEWCRIDDSPGNDLWMYYFDITDRTQDELVDFGSSREWNERQLHKIFDKKPSSTAGDAMGRYGGFDSYKLELSSYTPSYASDTEIGTLDTYRHVTGYIRLFNPREGFMEIREIHFIEGADKSLAVLEEHPYEFGFSEGPMVMSTNYVIPGQPTGMSTADYSAVLQDIINEMMNLGIDADIKSVDGPMMMDKNVLLGKIKWGMRQINKVNLKAGENINTKFAPMMTPLVGNTMIEKAGLAEQRLQYITNALDVITGRKDVGDRGDTTLGKDRMRLEAATRGIGRMMARHADAITMGLNVLLEMQRQKLAQYLTPDMINGGMVFGEEFNHSRVDPSIAQFDPNFDMTAPVRLELHANVKSYLSKEDELMRTIGISEAINNQFPWFFQTHPNGALEIIRRIMETGQWNGVDTIMEADQQTQNNVMQVPMQEVA